MANRRTRTLKIQQPAAQPPRPDLTKRQPRRANPEPLGPRLYGKRNETPTGAMFTLVPIDTGKN